MAKTKALISCAVTAQLICVFVFAYANCWFSHAQAHLFLIILLKHILWVHISTASPRRFNGPQSTSETRSKRATCALGTLSVRPVRVTVRREKSVRISCAFGLKYFKHA